MKRIVTYVGVQATSFSGATLLAFLLGAHPQISTVAEMHGPVNIVDIEKYLCSCGQRIKECEFWRSVEIGMRNRGFEFDVANFDTLFELNGFLLVQYLREGSFRNNTLDSIRDALFQIWPGEAQRLRRLVARNEALIETILSLTGSDVFVDTSKERLRLRTMRKFSKFNAYVIHLVRDVRGVAASRLRRKKAANAREAAQKWVKIHQRHQRALATLPQGSHIVVHYEDLCQDVQGVLKCLYRFCGVDPDIEIADFRAVPHHIIGNTMRLQSGSEIKLDERWKSMLTKDQLKEIDLVAGKLNRQYGYY
jgi:hypothetical protein